jgi:plastocyanin
VTGAPLSRRRLLAGTAASAAVFAAGARAKSSVEHHVLIQEFKFDPEHLSVRVGDVIKWTNMDLAPHTATADEFGWDTEELGRGQSAEVIVTEDMEIRYFCVFHPHMKGSLEIV